MKETKEILHSYLQVTRHMSRRFRQYYGQLDLTFPQALVLTALREEGEMPISKLAEYTGSANSTVSGIVDRLEKLGLARRVRSESDRRVIYVAPTGKYYDMLSKAQPNVDDCFSGVMDTLSEEDLNEIAAALQKLEHALERSDNKM